MRWQDLKLPGISWSFQSTTDFNNSYFWKNKVLVGLAIVVIGTVVILFNLFIPISEGLALSNEDWDFIEFDPDVIGEVVSEVSPYTPIIQEDVEELSLVLKTKTTDDFLDKNESVITEASKLETNYIVQKGDTISAIAKKFDLHVATLMDRNSLGVDKIESLSPGQEITIPPKDTSDSQDWLVQLNEKKEQERQLALKKQQERQKKLALSNRSTVYRDSSDSRGETSSGWAKPINYSYISRGISRGHAGIDMIASIGTPVYAAKSGKVASSTGGWGSGYGLSLLVDNGGGYSSRYAHMSDFAVGIGSYVEQGQVIGYSGNSGWSTGPHLHFEARKNGAPFNPW